MSRARCLTTASLALLLVHAPAIGAQVVAGQVDDFEDGTTQGWRVNLIPGMPAHPAPPTNVADGGPAGAGDGYLRLTSVGGPGGEAPAPGSRMAAINFGSQWAGSYTGAGITHIRLDARNFGSTELLLRMVFEDPALDFSGPPCHFGVSGTPQALAPGSDWTTLVFPLADLIHLPSGAPPCAPGGSLESLLANTTALRIIHNPVVAPNGAPVVAQLGVDNITAVAVVPEPATVLLVGGGLLALGMVARRRAAPRA